MLQSVSYTHLDVYKRQPLELEGRDLYIREGCNACHSQMIRPFRDEVVRYNGKNGQYSKAGEFVYDRPFLWGSRRTGPDLHREGGKNPDTWHFKHLLNPRVTSPGSIMPRYPWLVYHELDRSKTKEKLTLLKNVFGVPYSDEEINNVDKLVDDQAAKIVQGVYSGDPLIKKAFDDQKAKEWAEFIPVEKREVIAVIAYLQRLGTDIKTSEVKTASNN